MNGFSLDGENAQKVPLYSLRQEVAIWVKENLDEDAIIGAWNAGQLGFFSERRVVNLDGIVNHISYFNNVIRSNNLYSSTEFVEYLEQMNISYIIDYSFNGFIPEENNFLIIKEFKSESFDKIFQIWRRNTENLCIV